MAAFEGSLQGFAELSKLLRELPQAVENRVLQNASLAGARVMARGVKARAPRWKANSERNIRVNKKGKKYKIRKVRSKASEKYGPLKKAIRVSRVQKWTRERGRRGAKVTIGRAFYGFWEEMGNSRQPARPWFRPGMRAAQGPAFAKVAEITGKGIDREALRLAGRSARRR